MCLVPLLLAQLAVDRLILFVASFTRCVYARNAPVNDTKKNAVPFVIGVVVVGGIEQVQPESFPLANLLIKCLFLCFPRLCAPRIDSSWSISNDDDAYNNIPSQTESYRQYQQVNGLIHTHTIRCIQWLF